MEMKRGQVARRFTSFFLTKLRWANDDRHQADVAAAAGEVVIWFRGRERSISSLVGQVLKHRRKKFIYEEWCCEVRDRLDLIAGTLLPSVAAALRVHAGLFVDLDITWEQVQLAREHEQLECGFEV